MEKYVCVYIYIYIYMKDHIDLSYYQTSIFAMIIAMISLVCLSW